MSWTLDGRPLRRVLVTRLRYLGDIAMSTVVPAVLRRGDPGLEIDYLCEAPYAPLLTNHPLLARVHGLAVTRRGRDADVRRATAVSTTPTSRNTLATILALRARRFDLAVDLFFNPRSAWLLRLAGIPLRIGGATSRSRRSLYTHLALPPKPDHRPDLYAVAPGALGEHLSRLASLRHSDGREFLDWLAAEFMPTELAPQVAQPPLSADLAAVLGDLGVQHGRYTLLAPAATWLAKEWPVARWLELVAMLVAAGHRPVILCPPGGPGRYAELVRAIPAGQGGILPALGLAGALAVVAGASLLVSVDGGVMHAGVAMSVPTVALFGPTSPDIWFPYEGLGRYRVVATRPDCHPCGLHVCDHFVCMPGLEAGTVAAAVDRLNARGSVEL